MMAVQYRKNIPRYLVLRACGRRFPTLYTHACSLVHLCELEEPHLPSARWLRVRPLLSGICGSDLATLCAKGSAYLSPLTSTPFVLGHEVVGEVAEVGNAVTAVQRGDRVVVQPALGCAVRGIAQPCSACARGELALCSNVTTGDIAPGIQTGYCRDTGGAWSESLVAHESQIHKVPAEVEDEIAVLTEPFACAVHAVLRACPAVSAAETNDFQILIMGCGAIGLLTIAAIRALGITARIVAVAKHEHQRQHARRLGAEVVLAYHPDVSKRYAELARLLQARTLQPEIGKPTVVGGADLTFDCVASSESIDDCCRFTTAGGILTLVGMPAVPAGIDWTSIWYKELTVRAAYAYGREHHAGREQTTFELALDLLPRAGADLKPLVGPPFALPDYRKALRHALRSAESRSIKTVFRVQSRRS